MAGRACAPPVLPAPRRSVRPTYSRDGQELMELGATAAAETQTRAAAGAAATQPERARASVLRPAHAAAVEAARSGGGLVFDLNYHEHTSADEAGALCRQLTMSFAANRRAARPFPLLVVGGVGVPESDDPATINAASADDDHEEDPGALA